MATYDYQRHGSFLSGRDVGAATYQQVSNWLAGLPVGEEVSLDLTGVVMINTSFGDEAIGRILEEVRGGKYGQRKISVTGISNRSVTNALQRICEIRDIAKAS